MLLFLERGFLETSEIFLLRDSIYVDFSADYCVSKLSSYTFYLTQLPHKNFNGLTCLVLTAPLHITNQVHIYSNIIYQPT